MILLFFFFSHLIQPVKEFACFLTSPIFFFCVCIAEVSYLKHAKQSRKEKAKKKKEKKQLEPLYPIITYISHSRVRASE